ncbi:35878_t:CDS:2, partial [Racocetra persica]
MQKRNICLEKEKNPNIKNINLADCYNIRKSTITDILKEKRVIVNYYDHLAAYEYIHIEDGKLESGLTDNKILEVIENKNKEEEENHSEPVEQLEKVSSRETEISLKKILRFLYEQEPEFGEVKGEIRILNKLHKW